MFSWVANYAVELLLSIPGIILFVYIQALMFGYLRMPSLNVIAAWRRRQRRRAWLRREGP